MDCPACHTANLTGQKFCGTCGRKLESECPRCGASNPPQYKFCGECGANLALPGAISLAPSGLIASANPKALELLGYRKDEIEGKPFSLFVDRDDLVVFFSHWNEFRSRSKQQSFEIALKRKEGKSIYLLLDFGDDDQAGQDSMNVRVLLNEISKSRKVSAQMQFQEDLLNLVFSTTDALNTVSKEHMDRTVEDTLKKLCLVTEADRSFIYRFDRRLRRMDPAYQWCRESSSSEVTSEIKSVPLAKIKRAIVRMRKEQGYVIEDVAKLPPAEHSELLAWHQNNFGAFACHLIYASKRPIGIIGIGKDEAEGEWPPQFILLVKFIGQLISDKLPFAAVQPSKEHHNRNTLTTEDTQRSDPQPRKQKVIDIAEKLSWSHGDAGEHPEKSATSHPAAEPIRVPDLSRPMMLEKLADRGLADQQPVFPRDDGLVLLTCPRCSLQESVSNNQFEELGNALSVTCSCGKNFTAVREKRRAFRKSVHLAGHFSLKEDLSSAIGDGSIWGIMVVRDLSKAGLRFSSSKSELVHPGDLLMVRFHLDNSNKALIHKPARVISVTGEEVGCRFEGDDSSDITLGFYFI